MRRTLAPSECIALSCTTTAKAIWKPFVHMLAPAMIGWRKLAGLSGGSQSPDTTNLLVRVLPRGRPTYVSCFIRVISVHSRLRLASFQLNFHRLNDPPKLIFVRIRTDSARRIAPDLQSVRRHRFD